MPRQPVHPAGELGVGQTCPLERHRGRCRSARYPVGEQTGQGRGRIDSVLRAVPAAKYRRCFQRVQEREITQRTFRSLDHGLEQPDESLGEPRDRLAIEQIGRISEDRVDSRRRGPLAQIQLKIEFRGLQGHLDRADRQLGQLRAHRRGVLQRQHHLEQRMPGLRPHRVENLHQTFERQIGMPERGDIGSAHRTQQLGEPGTGIDRCPQHEGVDEHTDQIVEGTFTAARDRSADRDIGFPGQPRQQYRERRVYGHEQGRAFGPRQFGQPGMGFGVDLEHMGRAPARGERRPSPVRREVQLIRQSGQLLRPVRDLLVDHRFGIVLRTQYLPLPQREIGVLHLQRRPAGGIARGACHVRGHHVAQQRRHRETVTGDVMDDEAEHMVGRVQPEQPSPERHTRGDIEARRHQLREPRGQICRRDLDRSELQRHLGCRQHLLERSPADLRVEGPQRFVPRQHIGDGGAQRGRVEVAGQPDRDRDVVHERIRIEPVQEPHPLLRQRQRHPLHDLARREFLGRTWLRHQRRPPARLGPQFRARGQGGHGGRFEQDAHRNVDIQRPAEPGRDLGRDQRVAAEGEEVVVGADPLGTEHIGVDTGHDLLDRGRRRPELLRLEPRLRQCLAIQLPGRIQRELVQLQHGRRHHIGRQDRT